MVVAAVARVKFDFFLSLLKGFGKFILQDNIGEIRIISKSLDDEH